MSLKEKVVWLPYDFDTAIGINNEGKLVFGYELEDTDHLEGGADVYNGQESVIWKNIRVAFAKELAEMYKTLRSTGALSYQKVEQMFEEHQAKWPERLANEDSKFKYTDPGVEDGNWSYLEMLQGLKTEQRKWWLYNRFRYIDSKYNAGDALSDLIQLRGYAKADVTVTPYADIYPSVKYGSYLVQARGKRGTATTLPCPLDNVNDTEIYIYSSSQLASVGDLSGLKVGFADFSMATRLQNIKIGDSDPEYENRNLTALTLGNNILLKTLDVRNCPSLGTGDQKAVDISGCEIIEEVYFDGTAIQGLTLPNGGVLKKLHLPSTMTNLTILNQKAITEFVIPTYDNISTLRLENVSAVIDELAILNAVPAGSRVRLIGVAWECADAEEIEGILAVLDTMRGLNESGGNMDKAQVAGRIHIPTLTGSQKGSFEARYPYINYDADYLETTLTLKTWDSSSTIAEITCYNGVPQSEIPEVPVRESTAQYSYTPEGWNVSVDAQTGDADCVQNVTSDRTVYAAYSRTVRTYTVTFVRAAEDGGGTLQTLPYIPYGRTLSASSYTGATPTTTKGDAAEYPFQSWTPAFAPIIADTTYTARFGSPVEIAEITDSWERIITNIDNGTYADKYKLGNYKPLDLGDEGIINMQIVAMDEDVLSSGGTAPITFIGMEVLNTEKYSGSSGGGRWSNSTIHGFLQTDILPMIESRHKSVHDRLQRVNKISRYSISTSYNSTETTQDLLWIPNAREVGVGGTNVETYGVAYSKVYKNNPSRRKCKSGDSETTYMWATRTHFSYNAGVVVINPDGTYGNTYGRSYTCGVALSFCLGLEPETITDSWETILANESPSESYQIGDTKYLDLGAEGRHLMEIVAFDSDDKADGSGKAKITWISKTLLNSTHQMVSSYTGDWENTTLRTYLRSTVKDLIPETVRNSIVPVTKTTTVYVDGAVSTNGQTTADDVWIPSSRELNLPSPGETTGAIYSDKFAANADRVKNKNGEKAGYFTRTAMSRSIYVLVTESGGKGNGDGYYSRPFAIGFCTD